MLRFLSLEEACNQPYRSEFRYRPLWPGIAFLLTLAAGIGAGLNAVAMWKANWTVVIVLGWLSAWLFIFALICGSVLRARLRPTAWLVRLGTDGVLIKFRSYLNYHFAAADKVAVHIPFSKVEWARAHSLQQTMPSKADAGDTIYRHRYVELEVPAALVEDLQPYLAQERDRRGPMRSKWLGNGYSFSRHYPVQVPGGNVIRIEWEVHPGVREFLREMQRFVPVQEPAATSVDFRGLEGAAKVEQERRLLELVKSGNRIHAINVARHLYKMDLTTAVEFIDGLSHKDTQA